MNDKVAKNWFEQGGHTYAQFRPEYPLQLSSYLASIAPDTQCAVDVGCGNGQLTNQLTQYFSSVIGFDPSADQIANVIASQNFRHQGVRYQCAPAENIPLPNKSVSLITAAQAAHWFDLPKFYSEVRRIATDHAAIALISYGVLQLDSDLNERFNHFYYDEIGKYWPGEHQLVDTGYASIDFPFNSLIPPKMEIKLDWNLEQLLGYISTWSATKRAQDDGSNAMLKAFANDMSKAWGDPITKKIVRWPINMRVGNV